MNIYEDDKKKYVKYGFLLLFVLTFFFFIIFSTESGIYVEKSKEYAERGSYFYLFVHVKNTTERSEKNIQICVSSITPFLHIENNSMVIPVLPPMSEQIPKFKVNVDKNAIPGDHMLVVLVKKGEREYKENVYIRVV